MKEKNAYKFILFDADDTLIDFALDAERAFCVALRAVDRENEETLRACVEFDYGNWDRIGLSNVHLPEIQANFHTMYVEHVQAIFEHVEKTCGLGGRAREAETIFFKAFAEPSHVLGEAQAVLAELKKRYRIYGATNGITYLQRGRLTAFPLDGIFVSEELGVIKPNPAYFNRILLELHAVPQDCLMVGDSLSSDVRGANAAGIDVVWLNRRKQPRPTDVSVVAEITDLKELLEIL